jgi:hypothetical protein
MHHHRAGIRVRVEADVMAFLVVVRHRRILVGDGRGRLRQFRRDSDDRRFAGGSRRRGVARN